LSELDDELQQNSLTQVEMTERLGTAKSTLSNAKGRPDFPQWSKERDPDDIAWRWNPKTKRFVPADDNR
jgi:hypothetical protein